MIIGEIGALRTRRWIVGGLAVAGLVSGVVPAGPASARSTASLECVEHATTTSEGTPNAAVLRTIGVFRRPATGADVLPSEPTPPVGMGEGAYVKYVRLARTVGETSYYLIPIAKGCASLGEEVVEESRGPAGFSSRGGETLAEIKQGKGVSTWVHNASSTVWGVVPDKVASVVLIYTNPTGPKGHRSAKVSAPVINNVFVANLAFLTVQSPNFNATTIVWRSAEGTVVRRIHEKA